MDFKISPYQSFSSVAAKYSTKCFLRIGTVSAVQMTQKQFRELLEVMTKAISQKDTLFVYPKK